MGEKPTEADESEQRKSGSVVAGDFRRQQAQGGGETPAPPEPLEATTVKSSKSNTSD